MFKWNFYSLNFGDIYMFSSQFYLLSESITLPKTESKAMKVHTNKSSNNSLDILVKWNSLPFYYYILNIWSHPPFSSIITYYCISNFCTKLSRSLEWIYSLDLTWTAISATTTQMNLILKIHLHILTCKNIHFLIVNESTFLAFSYLRRLIYYGCLFVNKK